MTQSEIWFTDCEMNPAFISKVGFETETREASAFFVDNVKHPLKRYEVVEPELFPEPFFLGHRAKASLPDVFRIEGALPMVSARFREILERFEIVNTRFVERVIYDTDCETPVAGQFFFLNIAGVKDTLEHEASTGLDPRGQRWAVNLPHSGVALFGLEARQGADLWKERQIREATFMSDRLAKACKHARIKGPRNRGIKLYPVTLLGDG